VDNKLIIGLAVLAGAALILSGKKQDEEIETMTLILPDDFDPESVKGSQDG
jgi:hypothetical protein